MLEWHSTDYTSCPNKSDTGLQIRVVDNAWVASGTRSNERNHVEGDLVNFDGVETILDRGSDIYRARYFGGLVDQRPGE